MGLDLIVGAFARAEDEDSDGEAYAYLEGEYLTYARQQFAIINRVLTDAGLPLHHEPDPPPATWTCQMYGYGGLHYLRRIAAYLWTGLPLPPPGTDDDKHDNAVKACYDALDDPVASVADAGALGRTPRFRFEHLIQHGDCAGFYLPQRFDRVLLPTNLSDKEMEAIGCFIGSAPVVKEECEDLAQALGLPLTLDPEDDEVWDAADDQGAGGGWKRYGGESFTCVRLHYACRLAIESGCAVVFA
jgi:hypothetical protein